MCTENMQRIKIHIYINGINEKRCKTLYRGLFTQYFFLIKNMEA